MLQVGGLTQCLSKAQCGETSDSQPARAKENSPPIHRWVPVRRETSPARDGRNGPTLNEHLPLFGDLLSLPNPCPLLTVGWAIVFRPWRDLFTCGLYPPMNMNRWAIFFRPRGWGPLTCGIASLTRLVDPGSRHGAGRPCETDKFESGLDPLLGIAVRITKDLGRGRTVARALFAGWLDSAPRRPCHSDCARHL